MPTVVLLVCFLRLQVPRANVDADAVDSCVTYHIKPDDEGRDSL